ncbi:MAG: DUF6600 domain-containing protein [Acidobacteriota bacterium]
MSVSISVFHDQLAPHGRWVSASSYGSVWIPSGVAAGWEPYVEGEWVDTEYGWTWVSDDPWGDTPYHYGTWAWVEPHGWVWIPGTVWAPAWVTWAYTDDYVGWAPVPPTLSLSVRGYFGAPIVVRPTRYVFVPAPKFIGVRVSTVRVPIQQNAVIYKRASKTTRFEVSNGIVRVSGPPRKNIERAVGRPIERVSVDRIKTRPTSVEAAGISRSRSIRVVAPEKERLSASAAAQDKKEKSPSGAQARPASAAAPARSEHHEKAEHPNASRAKKEPAHAEAKPRDADAARAKPSAQKPETRRATEPDRSKPAAQRPETRAESAREPAANAPDAERPVHSERAPAKKPAEKQKPPKQQPPKDQPEGHRPD